MRNREAPTPTHIKGLLTLSGERNTGVKGQSNQTGSRVLAVEAVWLWRGGVGFFPILKPLTFSPERSLSSYPQVGFATG